MDRFLQKTGQTGIIIIAVILILQTILPYLSTETKGNQTTHSVSIDRKSLQDAVSPLLDPIESSLAGLTSENAKQCKADELSATTSTKLLEVITTLTTQQAITATAVATMQRQLERMSP